MVSYSLISAWSQKLLWTFGTATLLQLLVFPTPSEMADFMIGCRRGDFQPSSTCESVCRLLHNRSSCCYGVNYDSRAVCACCSLSRDGHCPTVCSAQCHIITLQAGNCSELRGTKHRSGGGPSILNDLPILSDPGPAGKYKQNHSPRSDPDSIEERLATTSATPIIPTASSAPATQAPAAKKKDTMSTTNKLLSRLSSILDT